MRFEIFSNDDTDEFPGMAEMRQLYYDSDEGLYRYDGSFVDDEGYVCRGERDDMKLRYFPGLDDLYYHKDVRSHWVLALADDDTILGAAKIRVKGQPETNRDPVFNDETGEVEWHHFGQILCFLEVNQDYWGQGISKKLSRAVFEHCVSQGFTSLLGTRRSEYGRERLARTFDALIAEFQDRIKYHGLDEDPFYLQMKWEEARRPKSLFERIRSVFVKNCLT